MVSEICMILCFHSFFTDCLLQACSNGCLFSFTNLMLRKINYLPLTCPVSPPLPPPPNADMEDGHFPMISAPSLSYGAAGTRSYRESTEYSRDYESQNYDSRRSQMELDEADWIPASYQEKGNSFLVICGVLTLWTPGDGLPTLRKLPTLLGVC